MVLGTLCSETKLGKMRSRSSMALLENYTLTLYPLQPTHLTEFSEILEKEMVWKRSDDCTASTIPYHPGDVWRSFSKFRNLLDANLEDWLSKKLTFTDRNGRPCQACAKEPGGDRHVRK